MIFKLIDKIPFMREAADEQIRYEKFKELIVEKLDEYQELTLPQLKDILQSGCDDLELSNCRHKMLFDFVVKSVA